MDDKDNYQAFIDSAFDRTAWGKPGIFRVQWPPGGDTVTIKEIPMDEFLDATLVSDVKRAIETGWAVSYGVYTGDRDNAVFDGCTEPDVVPVIIREPDNEER